MWSNSSYLLIGGNPSAPQRQYLKGRQLATMATPRWRDPQGNILVHFTEHQDAFVWVVYLVREKDDQGKASFANVEGMPNYGHDALKINWVWVGGTPCGKMPVWASSITSKMPVWASSITSKMPVHIREHQDAFFYKTPIVIDPCKSNPMCKN